MIIFSECKTNSQDYLNKVKQIYHQNIKKVHQVVTVNVIYQRKRNMVVNMIVNQLPVKEDSQPNKVEVKVTGVINVILDQYVKKHQNKRLVEKNLKDNNKKCSISMKNT